MSQDQIADLLADAVKKLSPGYVTFNTEYPIKILVHKNLKHPSTKKHISCRLRWRFFYKSIRRIAS